MSAPMDLEMERIGVRAAAILDDPMFATLIDELKSATARELFATEASEQEVRERCYLQMQVIDNLGKLLLRKHKAGEEAKTKRLKQQSESKS